jgi:RsiW-degrading membrane proteinase PrsW (M82 family)
MKRARRFAWLVMLIADVGLLAWGAMAALAPDYLPGPASKPILAAGYEGLTGRSWQELMTTSPAAAAFMRVLFRVYGAYVVAFGLLATAVAATAFRRGEPWSWWALLVGNTIAFVSAMTYDWTVGAIGPFELTEYVGLVMVWGALAVTAPFRGPARPVQAAG